MQKIKLEEKKHRKKRFAFLISFSIGITLVLALFQILLSNHLAGFGRELAILSSQKKDLAHENEILKKDIAKQRSIGTISKKARAMSLETASNFLVVGEKEVVALR